MSLTKKDNPITVMIADDHPPMRMGLITLINSQPNMHIIAEAADGEEAIEAKNLSLDLRGDKGAGVVMADQRQLGRAIGNILDNAIAAVPEKDGRILVMLARRKTSVRIVISDNGPGMLPGELARAMDGYALAGDGSGTEKRGLGLPLARQLIEAHGGRLNIQSEKGAGTTATITLP